jgi:hypothetical protein
VSIEEWFVRSFMEDGQKRSAFPRTGLLLPPLMFVALELFAGRRRLHERFRAQLDSIDRLRVPQISAWRNEHLGDAQTVQA